MDARKYSAEELKAAAPVLREDANKYTRGHLVLVAGCAAYPGAACLAAAAAQRAGAGYTEVRCAPETAPIIRGFRPSLVVRSWSGWHGEDLPVPRPSHPAAVAMGSGFDAEDGECLRRTWELLDAVQVPLLADGGALSAVAQPYGVEAMARRRQRGLITVVTPHEGEAARLARGIGLDGIAMAPAERARRLAEAYGCIVVLKGPDTYVSDGSETVLMDEGTAALAKAGTGDVLAGIIGALLAQGVRPLDAGVLGATLHARAAAGAVERLGNAASLIPEDLLDEIPSVLRRIDLQ